MTGLDPPGENLLHESDIIAMRSHRAADQRDMPREKLRHIQLEAVAAGAAHDQNPPADAAGAHALPQRRRAHIVDHHIDAAPIRQLVERARPLRLLFAVDRHIGADRFRLRAFLGIAADA